MGWGSWCLVARAFGCSVRGSEFSSLKIRNAERSGIEVVAWRDLPGHRFDFINSENVFEHLPKPLETLRRLADSLEPGGLLKINVPDGAGILRKLKVGDWSAPKGTKNSLNDVSPLEHVNCFRRRTLLKMAELAGLEPVHIPLGIRYEFGVGRKPIITILKDILRPLYHRLLNRGTYLFFRKKT